MLAKFVMRQAACMHVGPPALRGTRREIRNETRAWSPFWTCQIAYYVAALPKIAVTSHQSWVRERSFHHLRFVIHDS